MAKLLLVRHGKISLQKEDRYWGSTDIPLDDTGKKQAEQIRDYLAKEKITHVYSSALSRARETAEIIAALHGLDVKECPELNEFNFGYAEGLTYREIEKLHPSVAEEMERMDNVSFPGGESLGKFHTRVKTFLKRLEQHKPQDAVVIVAHGGSLRMLICSLLGLEPEHWYRMFLAPASISVVNMYPQVSILNLLNDVSHLKHLKK